jgi:hypothetical protein
MFKGFIPGRRVSSVDLAHDQELLNEISRIVASGKENAPTTTLNGPPAKSVPLTTSKMNAGKARDGKAGTLKGNAKATEQAPINSDDTSQAFDRLLVSV